MEKDTITHWLHHQAERISEDASSMAKDFYPEAIHHFRTGTKKLRAIMRLLAAKDGRDLKLPRSFHELYGASGELRDKQVLLQMLIAEKKHKPAMFAVWLAHRIGQAAHELQNAQSKQALHKLKDWIAAVDPVADLLSIRAYYKIKLQKIRQLLTPDASDEVLHEIRKVSKDLQHILDWCKKSWEQGYQIHRHLEAPLEHLAEQAGAYNDLRNLVDTLDEFEEEHSDWLEKDAAAAIAAARHDWLLRKARARKALLTAIRQLGSSRLGAMDKMQES